MPRTFYHEEIINTGLNPYEAVIASSREARRLNQARLASDIPEGTEKMATVALGRLVGGNVEVMRDGKLVEGDASNDAAGGQEASTGN